MHATNTLLLSCAFSSILTCNAAFARSKPLEKPKKCRSSEVCIYVSQYGNDKNAGTITQPLSTIIAARDKVRELRSKLGGGKNIRVLIGAGTYRMSEQINLDSPLDGADEGYSTVYESHSKETPWLDGAVRLDGYNGKKAMYTTYLTHTIRQLYCGDRQLERRGLRYDRDNLKIIDWSGHSGAIYTETNQDNRFITIEPLSGLKPDDLIGAEFWLQKEFGNQVLLISRAYSFGDKWRIELGGEEGRITFSQKHPRKWAKQAYSVFGEKISTGANGDWYQYADNKLLINFNSCPSRLIYLPTLQTIVNISGVKNLAIRGLGFRHSAWNQPASGYLPRQANALGSSDGKLVYPPGAIEIDNSRSTRIEECQFTKLGAHAIVAKSNNTKIHILNNKIYHTNGGGIYVNPDISVKDVNAGAFYSIIGNYISNIGNEYKDSVAIFSSYSHGMTIMHNKISHVPYTGISVGWGWSASKTNLGNNIIKYNNVIDAVNTLSDGGYIYTLSRQDGTIISENTLNGLRISKYATFKFVAGIYLDGGSSGISVIGNRFLTEGLDSANSPHIFNQRGNTGNTIFLAGRIQE